MKRNSILKAMLASVFLVVLISPTCLGALPPPQLEYTVDQYIAKLPNFNDIDTSDMVVAPDNFDDWTDQTWYLTPSTSSSVYNYIANAPMSNLNVGDQYYFLAYGWKDHPQYDWDSNEYMLIVAWNVTTGEPEDAGLIEFGVGWHDGVIITIADASINDLPITSSSGIGDFGSIEWYPTGLIIISAILSVVLVVLLYRANKKGVLDKKI